MQVCFCVWMCIRTYQAEVCKRQTLQAADTWDLVVLQAEIGELATLLKTTDLTETVVWEWAC